MDDDHRSDVSLQVPRRRMSDHKLQALAESSVLKLAQYAITGIAIPTLVYFGGKALDRLDRIDEAIGRAATQSATTELRLQAVERGNVDRDAALRMLTERQIRHELQIERLNDHMIRPPQARRLPE